MTTFRTTNERDFEKEGWSPGVEQEQFNTSQQLGRLYLLLGTDYVEPSVLVKPNERSKWRPECRDSLMCWHQCGIIDY